MRSMAKIFKLAFAFLLLPCIAQARTIESCEGGADGRDNVAAWNECLAEAQASNDDREIRFGAGTYQFNSAPDPITVDGITIVGTGPWTTHLRRTFNQGNTDSFIELQGRGSRLQGFEITAARGTSGGYGLYIITDNSKPASGKHQIEHLRISGDLINQVHYGTWRVALIIRGDARTVNPIGTRDGTLYNVEVFDSTLWLAEFWGAISWAWYGGGAWQGGGTTNGIAIGGANAQKNHIDADIDWASSSVAPGSRR